jgi:hypothetical protein
MDLFGCLVGSLATAKHLVAADFSTRKGGYYGSIALAKNTTWLLYLEVYKQCIGVIIIRHIYRNTPQNDTNLTTCVSRSPSYSVQPGGIS